MDRYLFTDWEGPWILTDFAFELSVAILNNDRFFRNLSQYDDYLAYEVRKEGYEAGYTVKLLVPFLKAAGVTNEGVRKIAEKVAKFVPDAETAMKYLQKTWVPVIISTSYIQYLEVTTKMIRANGKLHGTFVNFDIIKMDRKIADSLLQEVDLIGSLRGDKLHSHLDKLFSIEEVAKIIRDVKAVGAGEKAEILRKYCEEANIEVPIAIGDSISDYKMFEEVKELGGYAVAFNGNKYALEHADVAIVSNSAISEVAVARILTEKGIHALKSEDLIVSLLPNDLRSSFLQSNTKIFIIEDMDIEEVLQHSSRMRVRLRGDAGLLG
jgi:predicted HAD superfamily phosphohydrolase